LLPFGAGCQSDPVIRFFILVFSFSFLSWLDGVIHITHISFRVIFQRIQLLLFSFTYLTAAIAFNYSLNFVRE